MKKQFQLLKRATFVSLLLGVLVVGVAYAITITVDGIKDTVWDGSGGQTPGIQTDGDESSIDNRYDVKEVRWTNDSLPSSPFGHLYFLVETYNNFDVTFPPGASIIYFCLNIDNNTGTGSTVSGYCNNMAGVDRRINADVTNGVVTVYRWTGIFFQAVAQPAGGMRAVAYNDPEPNGIANTPYIEVGVDLESLAITNASTCLSSIPAAVYYDNGMADLEDNVTDTGTFTIGCGSPTAVTLETLSARNTTNMVPIGVAGVLLLGGALILFRSRKPTAE